MSTIKLVLTAAVLAASGAASAITVVNNSFETPSPGGYPYGGCGTGCTFSFSGLDPLTVVPGWVGTGDFGQFRPGTDQGNFAYFSTLADGPTNGFIANGSLQQTVAATAVAGTTYTLTVALGKRNDIPGPGQIELLVGSNSILATGTAAANGGWSDFVASYLATNADAGDAIIIRLSSLSNQGNFDNVRLDAAVPEPASWALLIAGFGLTGAALRRRRSAAIAA